MAQKPKPIRVRCICGVCLKVASVPIRQAALGLLLCCGRPVLIAGEIKQDHTGVTGRVGTIIDPVASYKAARTPIQRVPARKIRQ